MSNFQQTTVAQYPCNLLAPDEDDDEKDIVEVGISIVPTLAEWRMRFLEQTGYIVVEF